MTIVGRSIAGRSIVVCRAAHQAAPLLDQLVELGAVPVHVPLIEVVPPLDDGVELAERMQTSTPEWLALTSANGADAVARVLGGRSPSARIAVVGDATADRVRSLGWDVHFVAPMATGASLGASLPVPRGGLVLAPLAELASSGLADALRARDIDVEVVTAYRTIAPAVSAADIEQIIDSDAILITAPSVIRRLAHLVEPTELPALIVIGPSSAAAVLALGLPIAGLADEPSVDGLIAALVRTLGS